MCVYVCIVCVYCLCVWWYDYVCVCMYVCMYICMYVWNHVLNVCVFYVSMFALLILWFVCLCARMLVLCMYVCRCVCICLDVYLFYMCVIASLYVCVYAIVNMYVCMCVCMDGLYCVIWTRAKLWGGERPKWNKNGPTRV